MPLLQLTSAHRTTALGFVTGSLLVLLLAWQLSFKQTAIEKAFVAVNQSVVDITELNIDFSDFDQALPATLLQLGELSAWLDAATPVLSGSFDHTFIPQSRAPPILL
ncbi:hypothetical protein [Paraglaciecola sp.]|uniref:hypothetical protein n=1 Tax=Paraglaciecola sp. TaxID=1920173 RepID=UPI0030F3EB27